ncbi:hypothetical protein ABFS82_02G052700 [Erythranthe guttata]
MGLVALLKFALFCIDFLAWPVIALGYPVFASIRAIETGSKLHMKKLVVYWTLFGLISLFEFAFAKIIVWIPSWSSIKLVAAFWLVLPRFDGACLAYQDLLRPCLSVNPQAVLDRLLYWLKKEKPRKIVAFLDLAEEYIKENGSEALEKLIASKLEAKETDNTQRETQIQEPEEKLAAVNLESLKGPDISPEDNEMLKATAKTAAMETEQKTEVKEMIPPESSPRNRNQETPPFTKVHQPEWNCGLCQVTTKCEKTLNAHLQGNKHKSKCEYLKIKLYAEEMGPTTSVTAHISKQAKTEAAAKAKVGEASLQKSSENIELRLQVPNDQAKQAELKLDRQQKDSEKMEEIVRFQAANEQEKQGKAERDSAATQTFIPDRNSEHKEPDDSQGVTQFQEPEEKNAAIVTEPLKGLDTAQKVNIILAATDKTASTEMKQPEFKGMIAPEASPRKTPPLIKVHLQEWICGLCQVTTTSETTLNAHLRGSKHKSNCENLKSKTGPTTLVTALNQAKPVAAQVKVGEASQQKCSEKIEERVQFQVANEQEKRAKLRQEWQQKTSEKIEDNLDTKEPDNSQREARVQEPEEKNAAAMSEEFIYYFLQMKVSDTAPKDNKMLEATAKTATTEIKQKNEVKETIAPEASPRKTPNFHQQEWICGLCQVATTSEKTLNEHLRGSKHKSNCENLKSKLNAKETGPAISPTKAHLSNLPAAATEQEKWAKLKQEWQRKDYEKIEKSVGIDEVANELEKEKQGKLEQDGASSHTFKLHCDVCNVKLLSEIDMQSHLKGKRHSSNIENAGENKTVNK